MVNLADVVVFQLDRITGLQGIFRSANAGYVITGFKAEHRKGICIFESGASIATYGEPD